MPKQAFVDEFNTFYHAEGIVPHGMSINSYDAKKLIAEYEEENRERRKRLREQEILMNDMNAVMSKNMMDTLTRPKISDELYQRIMNDIEHEKDFDKKVKLYDLAIKLCRV